MGSTVKAGLGVCTDGTAISETTVVVHHLLEQRAHVEIDPEPQVVRPQLSKRSAV
jgi:hypothetical protein